MSHTQIRVLEAAKRLRALRGGPALTQVAPGYKFSLQSRERLRRSSKVVHCPSVVVKQLDNRPVAAIKGRG